MEITRKSYLNGDVSHSDYYREIARLAGVSYRNADPEFLGRVKSALDVGDKHLNGIRLWEWDLRGAAILNASAAFKAVGDFPTAAGLVCLVKQAAKDAVEEIWA